MRSHPHRSTLLVLLLAAMLTGPGRAADVDELQELARQWLDVRRELAEADAAWQREQATLVEEAALVNGRTASLAGEVARLEAEAAETARLAAAASARRASARAQLQQVLAPAQTAAAGLRQRLARTPPALRPPLRQAIASLPDPIGIDQLEVALPALFDAYNLILDLNRDLRAEREILPVPGGTEREMDVLYIGRAIGFAVSLDDRSAAIGRPLGERWEWQWQDDLAPVIRQALAISRRQSSAALVELPLAVGEAAP